MIVEWLMTINRNGEREQHDPNDDSSRQATATLDGEDSPGTDGATSPVLEKSYVASMSRTSVPEELASAVLDLESVLGLPVWFLAHGIEPAAVDLFFRTRHDLPNDRPIALLIDSPGGYARSAYQIANILRQRCGFVAIVPRQAKSAATLLALGASDIILGTYGELGPLDAQTFDPDREGYGSALDEVQALEQLNTVALEVFVDTLVVLKATSRKKFDSLLPLALQFAASIVRPLLEDIDAVQYTKMSRALKVAQEYAERLLQPRYTAEDAKHIADQLITQYPEHAFVIDAYEAAEIGLEVKIPPENVGDILDRMVTPLQELGQKRVSLVGHLIEKGDQQ